MATSSKNRVNYLPTPVETHHEDPFRDDVFERKPMAVNLTKLVSSFSTQPFVLGINGSWGSGKTKFLEMWAGHLKLQGFRTLHFNAWENDHNEDPFAAVLSVFRRLTEVAKNDKKSTIRKKWDQVVEKSLPILKQASALVVKNITQGILDLKSEETEAIISGIAEESAKHALQRCEDSRKSIERFRSELQSFVEAADDPDKPIVYFVDELDRCRPTFAISVLERIKHLLNVPGVTFVFAWDRQQLNGTIRSVYGDQTDPGGYLLRFVDLEMNLPPGNSNAFCRALLKRFGLWDLFHAEYMGKAIDCILSKFPLYSQCFKLTIREQEKVFVALSISWRIGLTEHVLVIEMWILLVMLRLKDPDIYHGIGDINFYDQLVKANLPSVLGAEYWDSPTGGWLEGCFLYALPVNNRNAMIQNLQAILNSLDGRKSNSRDNAIYDGIMFSQQFGNNRGGLVMTIIRQIEFSEMFWP